MTTPLSLPEFQSLIEARSQTDYEVRASRIWAAAASYVTWTVFAIAYFYRAQLGTTYPFISGLLGLFGFFFSALTSLLIFHIMNRRNLHFAREEALLTRTLEELKSKTSQADMKTLLPLTSAEQNLGRLSETGDHSAILWALLTAVPYAGWIFLIIALAFVSHDFSKHELQENMVVEDLDRVLRSQGSQGLPTRLGKIPKQPVILYLVLSVFTVSVFPVVWLYLAIEDPRTHFAYHRTAEAYLIPGPQPAATSAGLV